jgi:hypothetical protein
MKTITDSEINSEAWKLYPNTNRTTHRDNFRKGAKWYRSQIEQTDWISVDERLPEHSNIVLVFNGIDFDFGVYSDGFILYFEHLRSVRNWTVTHWQPLPSAPTLVNQRKE